MLLVLGIPTRVLCAVVHNRFSRFMIGTAHTRAHVCVHPLSTHTTPPRPGPSQPRLLACHVTLRGRKTRVTLVFSHSHSRSLARFLSLACLLAGWPTKGLILTGAGPRSRAGARSGRRSGRRSPAPRSCRCCPRCPRARRDCEDRQQTTDDDRSC